MASYSLLNIMRNLINGMLHFRYGSKITNQKNYCIPSSLLKKLATSITIPVITYDKKEIGGVPSDVMENFTVLLEGQVRNPSSAEGLWCTIQVYYSFYRAFQSSPRYTNDEAEIEASKIIYYTLPEQLTRSEIIETGSSRYDKFYKRDDGTYYMKSFFHDSDTNSWIEQQSDF